MVNKFSAFESLTKIPEVGEDEILHVGLNKNQDHFVLTFRNSYKRTNPVTDEEEIQPCGTSSATRRYMQRFFERTSLQSRWPSERLSVPVVDTAAMIIAAWPREQRKFDTDAVRKVAELLTVVKKQQAAAAMIAAFKERNVYSNGVFEVHEKYPLAMYQKVGLHAAITAGNFGLFMQQGTGKTAVDVARICNEAKTAADEGHFYRGIVVCPKNVRFNWLCEIEKFSTVKGSVTIIDGTQMERGKLLVESLVVKKPGDKFSIVVMNYETVDSCKENFKIVKALLATTEKFDFDKGNIFDLGVLDESHYIKTPSAKRSKACLWLRDQCQHRMVLTGTPITNHPFDLYMQLEFLGKGWSGFSSYSAFKNFYGIFESGAMGYDKLVDLQNVPILKERLSRVSFQISKKEALPNLPEKLYDTLEVSMTKEQKEMYVKVAAQIAHEVEMEQAAGSIKKELMVNHILTKLLRLAQITSGHVGFSEVRDELTDEVIEEKSSYVFKENPKLDATIEVLKEKNKNEKTIIWACFVTDIKAISARLTAEGIKHVTYYGATTTQAREAAVKSFNEDKECKVFLANPSAASTGLNLLGYPPGNGDDYETDCDHVIYFSQNWSSDKRIQSEDRCHRRGTRKNVRITDLVIPGTIDVEIRRRVEAKREMAEDVSDVQSVLKNIMDSIKSIF